MNSVESKFESPVCLLSMFQLRNGNFLITNADLLRAYALVTLYNKKTRYLEHQPSTLDVCIGLGSPLRSRDSGASLSIVPLKSKLLNPSLI